MEEVEFKFEYDEAPITEKNPNIVGYDFYELKVAGVNLHNAKGEKSWGFVAGYTEREPKNRYNHNAIKLVSIPSKRKIGYVSEDELEDFKEWSNDRKYPFVGFIAPFTTDEGEQMNFGRVYVIKPFEGEQEKTVEAIQHFGKIANDEYKQAINDFYNNKNGGSGGCFPMILLFVLFGLMIL